MAEDALLASISEYIGHASVITPGDDSAILHIVLEQVSGPEDVPTRPSLHSRAAKSVDEDEIGSTCVPFAVVGDLKRTNAITDRRLRRLSSIALGLGLLLSKDAVDEFRHGAALSRYLRRPIHTMQ